MLLPLLGRPTCGEFLLKGVHRSKTHSSSEVSCRHLLAEAKFSTHLLPNLEFLNLSRNGLRKTFDEFDVAGNFVVGQIPLAKYFEIFTYESRAVLQLDPGTQLFTILLIGHAHDSRLLNRRMREEKLFDFARID